MLSSIEQNIKLKIEKAGKRLKDWDIQINYGIKTGFNEAFIISSEKRNELLQKCPECDEIIRPILLGRNIKRYSFEWEGLWLINSHNGNKNQGIARVEVDRDYPTIFKYLAQFQLKLEKRLDKGDHWTNLRNCAYLEDFNKYKIAWGNLSLNAQFSLIPPSFVINAPSPFFSTDNLYLLAVLNSVIGDYYIKQLGVSRSGGYIEYKPMFVGNLPIPEVTEEQQEPIKKLAENIIANRLKGTNVIALEKELNDKIFKLYDMTDQEIFIIESQTAKE